MLPEEENVQGAVTYYFTLSLIVVCWWLFERRSVKHTQ
jgi:cbb3-type cytochrome oxidase subunit 3